MTSPPLLGNGVGELVDLSLASSECTETSLRHPAGLLVLAVSVIRESNASQFNTSSETLC